MSKYGIRNRPRGIIVSITLTCLLFLPIIKVSSLWSHGSSLPGFDKKVSYISLSCLGKQIYHGRIFFFPLKLLKKLKPCLYGIFPFVASPFVLCLNLFSLGLSDSGVCIIFHWLLVLIAQCHLVCQEVPTQLKEQWIQHSSWACISVLRSRLQLLLLQPTPLLYWVCACKCCC